MLYRELNQFRRYWTENVHLGGCTIDRRKLCRRGISKHRHLNSVRSKTLYVYYFRVVFRGIKSVD